MDRRQVQKAIQSITNEFAKLSEKSKVPLRVIRYHLGNVLETGSPQGKVPDIRGYFLWFASDA